MRAGLRVFETRARKLYARGIVGVVDVGNIIVEILPKIREGGSQSERVAFLGNLLKFTGNEPLGLTAADIAIGESGMLEAVLAWAAKTIAANLSEGAPRRYTACEEASTAVRGRVELRHLVRQRPGRAFELTIRHAPFREDNPVNRVVRWLVGEIGKRTRSLRIRALCRRLLETLSHVSDIAPTLAYLDGVILNFAEMTWSPIIALARMFIAQQQADPVRGGSLPAVAILFTLHDLFETAIRRVLGEGLRAEGLSLQRNSGHLLYSTRSRAGLLALRPDFRIGLSGTNSAKIVGDAKWKRIFKGTGRANLREDDAYQMAAYLAAIGASAGFMVCPLSESEPHPLVSLEFTMSGLDCQFTVIGIQLAVLIADNSHGIRLRQALCGSVSGLLAPSSQVA
ncbi:McrC family protein [Rhizobium leguminosarum]|uniref:McrC family protein n=1 Tax=Rhizobium leguminosarum TaxID=384 RepID=UPI003F9C9E2D